MFFSFFLQSFNKTKIQLGFSLIKVLGIPVILILESPSLQPVTPVPQLPLRQDPGDVGEGFHFLPCPSTSGWCHLPQDPGQRLWAEGTKDMGSGQRKGSCLKKQHIGHGEI